MRSLIPAAFLALLALPVLAAPAPVVAVPEVRIDNFAFEPREITVRPGAAVAWVNHDDSPHTVAGTDGAFSSAALDTGDRFTRTFTKPGRYDYFCTMHPHMVGTVIVAP
jgi:plastocyanin